MLNPVNFVRVFVAYGRHLIFLMGLLLWAIHAQATEIQELRVLTHGSFSVSPALVRSFEKHHQAKLIIIKAGGAGEMVNKLLLTRKNPIADVVFGISPNTHRKKLQGLLSAYQDVAYGHLAFNIDRAWLKKHHLPIPKTIHDLAQVQYKNLVAIPNPINSGTGQSLLMANVLHMGEEKTWQWWRHMHANGLKLSKGWTEMYYRDFTLHGGLRPIVLSYDTSPAAELLYSKKKMATLPSLSLKLPGAYITEIEGAGILAQSDKQDLGKKWLAWLHSKAIQTELQTRMWLLPIRRDIPLHETLKRVGIHHEQTPSLRRQIWNDAWLVHWKRNIYRLFSS